MLGHLEKHGLSGDITFVYGDTHDGLLATPLWARVGGALEAPLTRSLGNLGQLALGTLGLVAVPLLFLVMYLAFVQLSRVSGGDKTGLMRLAGAYAYSLVPIALVYQVAHYDRGRQRGPLRKSELGDDWTVLDPDNRYFRVVDETNYRTATGLI